MEHSLKIRAIAIDLDGTLLTSTKIITDRTIATLAKVMEQGIKVSIATGRSLDTAIRFIRQVGTPFPAVCYNGSCIYDPVTGQDLWHITLERNICEDIVRISGKVASHLHVFMDHTLYFTEKGRHADYLEPLSSQLGKTIDFFTMDDMRFTKAMFIGDPKETAAIGAQLKEKYGDSLHLVYSHPDYFEIMTGGATKGSALARLMSMYHITSDQVLAFGDADNDKEMLSWARYGIAMGNSHESVKSVAAGIAGHNDADGVAEKIEELFGFPLYA
jgi:Cof subfamily protein (haloacid dehalogenase superfamily)